MGLATFWANFSQTHLVTLISTLGAEFDPQSRVARFFGTTYQNGEEYTKLPQNVSSGNKMQQLAVK
jgi:hypothetical protein